MALKTEKPAATAAPPTILTHHNAISAGLIKQNANVLISVVLTSVPIVAFFVAHAPALIA